MQLYRYDKYNFNLLENRRQRTFLTMTFHDCACSDVNSNWQRWLIHYWLANLLVTRDNLRHLRVWTCRINPVRLTRPKWLIIGHSFTTVNVSNGIVLYAYYRVLLFAPPWAPHSYVWNVICMFWCDSFSKFYSTRMSVPLLKQLHRQIHCVTGCSVVR